MGICICPESNNIVRRIILNYIFCDIQFHLKNVAEIKVPSQPNAMLLNQQVTTLKEQDNCDDSININKENENESYRKNDSIIQIRNEIKNKKETKQLIKSSTFNKETQKTNSFIIINLNENENNFNTSKNINRFRSSFTLQFNNVRKQHLETVLEKISEVNSKNDSSMSKDEEKIEESERSEQSGNNTKIMPENVIKGSDNKINE